MSAIKLPSICFHTHIYRLFHGFLTFLHLGVWDTKFSSIVSLTLSGIPIAPFNPTYYYEEMNHVTCTHTSHLLLTTGWKSNSRYPPFLCNLFWCNELAKGGTTQCCHPNTALPNTVFCFVHQLHISQNWKTNLKKEPGWWRQNFANNRHAP